LKGAITVVFESFIRRNSNNTHQFCSSLHFTRNQFTCAVHAHSSTFQEPETLISGTLQDQIHFPGLSRSWKF